MDGKHPSIWLSHSASRVPSKQSRCRAPPRHLRPICRGSFHQISHKFLPRHPGVSLTIIKRRSRSPNFNDNLIMRTVLRHTLLVDMIGIISIRTILMLAMMLFCSLHSMRVPIHGFPTTWGSLLMGNRLLQAALIRTDPHLLQVVNSIGSEGENYLIAQWYASLLTMLLQVPQATQHTNVINV